MLITRVSEDSFDSASVGCENDGSGGLNAGEVFREMVVSYERQRANEQELEKARLQKLSSEKAKETDHKIHVNRENLKLERENLNIKLKIAEMEAQNVRRRSSADFDEEIVDTRCADFLTVVITFKVHFLHSGTALVKPRLGRLPAFNGYTMALTIEALTSVTDVLINTLYDTQYFNAAVSFLRNLERDSEFVGWSGLERRFEYITSGKDGEHGKHGRDGQDGSFGGSDGSSGHNGIPGKEGHSATDCEVSLMVVPGQNIFLVSRKNKPQNPTMMPLYDGSVKIDLRARGGAGGVGGNGGKGGNGSDGRDGIDVSVNYVILVFDIVTIVYRPLVTHKAPPAPTEDVEAMVGMVRTEATRATARTFSST